MNPVVQEIFSFFSIHLRMVVVVAVASLTTTVYPGRCRMFFLSRKFSSSCVLCVSVALSVVVAYIRWRLGFCTERCCYIYVWPRLELFSVIFFFVCLRVRRSNGGGVFASGVPATGTGAAGPPRFRTKGVSLAKVRVSAETIPEGVK